VRNFNEDNDFKEGQPIQISSFPCLMGLNWCSDEVDLKNL
jgi:hypothetical protein